MTTTVTIPTTVGFILLTLKKAGYEAYIVGGAVRDILLTDTDTLHHVLDWDITTNAQPAEIQALFTDSFYENEFGTVGVAHEHILEQMNWPQPEVFDQLLPTASSSQHRIIDLAEATKLHESLTEALPTENQTSASRPQFQPYEITTYRSESLYADFRRPTNVSWGTTIQEDLQRRDFTINALALTIDQENLSTMVAAATTSSSPTFTLDEAKYTLVDEYAGLQDLQAGLIKTVGDPDQRFTEDGLRMLRAVRFSVQLNMQIEDSTFASIQRNAQLLPHISWERIGDEVMKMLNSDYPAEAIEILDETGLLAHILPELAEGKGVAQGGHHTTDVWTHSLDALRECPSSDPVVRLATLIHDIGKPATYAEKDGQITFYNHEIVGSRLAKKIGRRFRLAKKDVDRLFILVRFHMFYYQPHNTDASIRRFMRKVGLANLDDILDLREGDRLGSGARRTSWRLEEMKQRMIEQLHQPMDVTDLALNGHDLMEHFDQPAGKWIGDVQSQLLELVLEQPELNTKEQLLTKARAILDQL